MTKLLHFTIFNALLCLCIGLVAKAQQNSIDSNTNPTSKSSYFVEAGVNLTLGGIVQGTGIYNSGDSVYLKAIPYPGYTFKNWTEYGVEKSTNPIFGIKVNSDKYFMANFKSMFDNGINIALPGYCVGPFLPGDYDSDGDIDILATGFYNSSSRSIIIRNEGKSQYTILSNLMFLNFVNQNAGHWFDFDSDNDLDLILSGTINNTSKRATKIYRNDGKDVFTDIYIEELADIEAGIIDCGDFNNDGWTDILLIGWDGQNDVKNIYINNKNEGFIKQNILESIYYSFGSAQFGDCDNDGDLDIIATEANGGHHITEIFLNNGNGGLEQEPIILSSNYSGPLESADFDNDGDLDILLSGNEDVKMTTSIQIFQNNGNKKFSNIVLLDTAVYQPFISKFGDFNNDGLLDVILKIAPDKLNIYLNKGYGNFEIYKDKPYFNTNKIVVFDNDSDGDMDYALFGTNYNNDAIMRLHNNVNSNPNQKPIAPNNLSTKFNNNAIEFYWDRAFDHENSSKGLSYNLYLKKQGESGYIRSPQAAITNDTLNGRKLIPEMGFIQWPDSGYSIKDLSIGTYYWSVQSIDASFAGSNFAPEQTFTIDSLFPSAITDSATLINATKVMLYGKAFAGNLETTVNFEYTLTPEINTSWISIQASPTVIDGVDLHAASVKIENLEYNSTYTYRLKATNSLGTSLGQNLKINTPSLFASKSTDLPILYSGNIVWGDYDNDGFMDVLVFGIDANANHLVTKLYHNNKDATFSEIENPGFLEICTGSASWGDFDNDGDLDLVVSGDTSYHSRKPAIELYRNLGMGSFEKVNGNNFSAVCWKSDLKWNDCNNDGKLDLLITGIGFSQPLTKLYLNKGNGVFEEKLNSGIPELWNSSCDWADFNNDGWSDILIQGISFGENKTYILKNNKNSSFSNINNSPFQGLQNGITKCSDFNNDGKMDYFLSGQSPINDYLPEINIYLNNGNDSFVKKENNGIEQMQIYSANNGDMDADGITDLLLTSDNQVYKVLFNKNIGEGFFTDFSSKSNFLEKLYYVNAADVDSDGDLDFMGFGYDEHIVYVTNLFLNQIDIQNNAPEAPTNLKTTQFIAQNTLSWNPSTDVETASKVLTYNVRIGTISGGCDIVSPNANSNGRLTLPTSGNAQTNTTFIIDSLPAGIYYWSVQAIDASYVGSEFSEENVFFVYPSAPIVEDVSACYGSKIPELLALGENIKWYADGDLTQMIGEGNSFAPSETESGVYTFYVNQTVEGSVSLADTVYLTIYNKPEVIISDSTNITCFGYANGTATALASGSVAPYNYLWNDKNLTTLAKVNGLSANYMYQVIAMDANGCSDTIRVTLSQPEPLSLQSNFSELICKDAQNGYIDIFVSGGTPVYKYKWSNGSIAEDLVDVAVGNYHVDITDKNQCKLTSDFTISGTSPYSNQEICLVSVKNNKNQIIWEKISDAGIASYSIYRESNSVGIYDKIGSVPTNELSVFIDENSNPNQRAYQYKIAVVDTCGNESDLSNYHRTMHLQINMGINAYNLNWDSYVYEGGGFTFDYFDIYRGSSPDNMTVIGSIGANYHSTTDENPPAGLLYYQIAGIKSNACQPTGSQKTAENYGISLSNIEDNGYTLINEKDQNPINVFPNPFENSLSIESGKLSIKQISITNLVGQTVYSTELNNNKISISTEEFIKGTYLITVVFSDDSITYQLIIKE